MSTHRIGRLLSAVVAMLLTACATVPSDASGDDRLTFFHLNDTYRIGAVDSGTAGGFGRVVTLLRKAKMEGRDVRLLHGGDFLYPSLESQLWHGQQMIDAFNFMAGIAPMLVVAGNHEFDRRTPEHLADAMRASQFAWLGDNYRLQTGDADVDALLERAHVMQYGERRIGVFALTLHADDGGNERAYVPVDRDYVGAARRAMTSLAEQRVDAIIGLTHLHLWQDEEIAALKKEFPRLLFIAGGHEHEPQFIAPTAERAAVVKGASNAREIWRIEIVFGDEGPELGALQKIVVDDSIASDAEYDRLEARWRGRLLDKFPFLTARVGEAAVPMDARETTIRSEESAWGNFIVDQMRRAFGQPLADFAFVNSGTLRIDDFVSGDIVFEDIGRTFGFSSYLRYMTLSGTETKNVLEAGFRGREPGQGFFPQVSGFRVCADYSRPAGERIVSLQRPTDKGWVDVGTDAEFTVVVPDFLYRGGDGYRFPAHREASRPASELKYLVLDAIMAAQADGRKVGAAVDPRNPRIVVLESAGDACWPL
ncbi:MAG: 5'-nucleotidase C-terminal domain-containing protein [Woeseiaceae bacterium]|nr:5'-nucleotidase C-terminal domain-containing protein [Woeseiaceae bacterium]